MLILIKMRWKKLIIDYNSLPDSQRANIDYFLNRADTGRMMILRDKFSMARKRSLEDSRGEVIRELTFGHIPFIDFLQWLCHVDLEGNNTLFVYEAEEDFLEEQNLDSLYDSAKVKVTPIYDVDVDSLSEIVLVDVTKLDDTQQVLYTFAAPSKIQDKSSGSLVLENHIYLAYIVIDFSTKSIVLYMHPTTSLYSIHGQEKKREMDDVTWVLLRYFRENFISFNLKEPNWLPDALVQISEEYFAHNNEMVKTKTEKFVNDFLPGMLENLVEFDPLVDKEESLLRLKRGIQKIYENELVTIHGRVEIGVNFHVFLQHADRGAIQFRADSRGKAISHADGGDIVTLMAEHGDLLNIGIVHIAEGQDYSYIVKKAEKYYSLKKYRTSGAKKEVVDDVLRKLNEYKSEIESTNPSGETDDSRRRVDGAEA